VAKILVAADLPEYPKVLLRRTAHSRIGDAVQVDEPVELPPSAANYFL
jgi:hypothetical protein